ncbi:MAG: hypothetical protein EZS28_005142 [Streblomastix strix]|uniref:Uncharacterized protein n=1 Tax=Streblomastix strix TaxID=222440 RepID=A0A5J4WYP3_9EUKA|nr:MAG: hypothetical protein EZS28_005142 [Streblomastix strix]
MNKVNSQSQQVDVISNEYQITAIINLSENNDKDVHVSHEIYRIGLNLGDDYLQAAQQTKEVKKQLDTKLTELMTQLATQSNSGDNSQVQSNEENTFSSARKRKRPEQESQEQK